ncbi:T9SS type A sorting domain-containing protein [Adhaeribacter rhizoryzae]|uniref:T9SS type A sorting domain-containing protein n=1 Tax=Adhaeribacter rhizoryzae TaxID=2607907 RepID=A0A5M6DSF5_9BACT|nr:T9SS type A sorting domain-containing protein [Adhaeribacter rhizoryzae]KAA5549246.1 T9SS type A sorting domain-containing protein [Adhaeribacter rhizoryzae]
MNQNLVNNKVTVVGLCLLLVFCSTFYFSISNSEEPVRSKKDLKAAVAAMKKIRKLVKSSIGTPEDPQARYEFEFKRLRDPKTGKIPENIRQKELAFSASIPTAELNNLNKFGRNARGMVQNWDSRGPYNVGGRTRALALDVTDENIILAGGVSGGMWRSTNNGNSWVKTTDPAIIQSVTTVDQDRRPNKTNIWYYGTGELEGNSASATAAPYRGNGIYKSTNNGQSWTVLPATVTNDVSTFNNVFQWVWRVKTNPANTNQDEVLAATIGGIQRSVNGGNTWSNVLGTGNAAQSNNQTRYTDIDIAPNGVMYATLSQATNTGTGSATRRGIYRSTDGVNWADITPSGWPTVYRRVVLDISPSNPNVVYFLADTPGSGLFDANLWKYTYVSGNGSGAGGVWENRSNNIPAFGGLVGNYDHQSSYNMVIEVRPDNPNIVFIGGTNLYRSTDGFASRNNIKWIGGYTLQNTAAKYPEHHPDQHALAFYPSNPARMVSAHDGGLSRTQNSLATDTVRWESLNRGYLTTQFTSVAMDLDTREEFVMGGMQDNGTYAADEDGPTSEWYSLLTGDGAFGAAVANSLIVSAQNGFIYRYAFSSTGQFQGYARIDPLGGTGYIFVNPYVIDPNNQYVMYLPAGDSLWRNSNIEAIPVGTGDKFGEQQTTNWKIISNTNTDENISAIAVSKTPANIVYFGTDQGKMYKLTNASASDNPPRTEITGTNFPADGYINCIAVDPTNADHIIVVFSNYNVMSLFETTNGGTSWTAVGGNLEQNSDGTGNGPSVRWASILPSTRGDTKFFVGTSTGLYASPALNGNNTIWVKEGGATIGNVPVEMVISRSIDDMVLVGTHGNGVYSLRYTATISVPDPGEGGSFTVAQNYPNPFRPGQNTTIAYNLIQPGQVSVKIYDLAGKVVANLVDASQPAGEYRITWNGLGQRGGYLANGIYIYSVQVGKEQKSKQLLLLR